PDDALALMRQYGIRGDNATMQRYLAGVGYHALLIGVVSGLINSYPPAPGDFDRWLADPHAGGGLRMSELDLTQRRTHILHYAYYGLDANQRLLLSRIAALRDAVDYDTLAALSPYLPPRPEEVPEPQTPDADFARRLLERRLILAKGNARRRAIQ